MSKWHYGCWRQPHRQADLLVHGSDDLSLVSNILQQVSVCVGASHPLFWSISSLLWIVLLCQKFCNEYLCPLRPASASSLLLDCEDLSVHYRLSYISDFLVIKVSERRRRTRSEYTTWRIITNYSLLPFFCLFQRIDDCSKHATNLGPSTTTGMAEVEKEEPKSEDECACAICLEEYHAGDEVCWSRSPKCRHVYHRACAEQWLLYDDKCPCCRNSYLEPSHDGDNNADKQYVPPLERNETNPRPYYHHQSLLYARGVVTTSEEVPPWIMFFWTKKSEKGTTCMLLASCFFRESPVQPPN
jgi:hypothetical protein